MTVDEAVQIVARQVLRNAVDDIDRESYPDFGEYDWGKVLEAVECLVAEPPLDEYRAAYALLESRADK